MGVTVRLYRSGGRSWSLAELWLAECEVDTRKLARQPAPAAGRRSLQSFALSSVPAASESPRAVSVMGRNRYGRIDSCGPSAISRPWGTAMIPMHASLRRQAAIADDIR